MTRPLCHARVDEVYSLVSAPKLRRTGIVEVEGIIARHTLLKKRLDMHRGDVLEMLAELPSGFHAPEHRGWSVAEMILDRHGTMWTTEMPTIEKLCVLGIGLGLAHWCSPRSTWSRLPGGLPYIVVELQHRLILQ